MKSLIWVFALVILVVLKCCQPLVRFQLCVVGFHRYGHLALEPEIFLAEQEIIMETGASPRRVINIWSLGPVAKQSNRYLASKWKQELFVIPSWLVSSLHSVGSFFPILKLSEPKLSVTGSMNGLDKTTSHVSFKANEIEEGKKQQ